MNIFVVEAVVSFCCYCCRGFWFGFCVASDLELLLLMNCCCSCGSCTEIVWGMLTTITEASWCQARNQEKVPTSVISHISSPRFPCTLLNLNLWIRIFQHHRLGLPMQTLTSFNWRSEPTLVVWQLTLSLLGSTENVSRKTFLSIYPFANKLTSVLKQFFFQFWNSQPNLEVPPVSFVSQG